MTDVLVAHEPSTSALLPYLPRLCRWPTLATGVAVAWALAWWFAGDVTDEVDAIWLLRGTLAVGAVSAVFVFDDASRNVTEPLVGTRRFLAPLRVAVSIGVVAISVLPAAMSVGHHVSGTLAWGLALEGIAVLALFTGAALTLQRRWQVAEPAQYTALGVLLLAVVDQLSAGRWPLLVGPGPHWASAHGRWVVVAAAALLVCAWQLRDPASRRWVGRGR